MWSWLFAWPVTPEQAQASQASDADLTPQDRFTLRLQHIALAQPACGGLPFSPK